MHYLRQHQYIDSLATMLMMNVGIMLRRWRSSIKRKCTHTKKSKLNHEKLQNMNYKFSSTKNYSQVLQVTIIIFYIFFTHTKSLIWFYAFCTEIGLSSIDSITHFAIKGKVVSRRRKSHRKIFNLLSSAKLKSRRSLNFNVF